MRQPKARHQEDAKPDKQVHKLFNGASVLEVTIEGSSVSIKGLLGTSEQVPYSSIELARQHWEHLVDLGWQPVEAQ